MKPYWQSPDGAIVVYHARFEDVLAAGCVDVPRVALVHDDPPYGIALNTRRRSNKGNGGRIPAGYARDWAPVVGDAAPFDPEPIIALGRRTVLWGGNHFASRLPDSPSWLFWDKREEQPEIDNACGEMAWTNLGGPVRRFAFLWRGLTRRGEGMGGAHGSSPHLHPTQKPIALCSWVYQRAKLKRGDLVFVPHGGSGPDLPACVAMGLRLVWCDVEQWCCDTAIARLGAVTAERAAEPAGPLFEARR